MDIKEEHNEFFHELDGRGFIFQNKNWLGGCFEDDQLQVVWEMWSSAKHGAKAQAVPEFPVMVFDEWFKKRHEKTGLYEEALCGKDDATYIRHEMRKAFQAGWKEKQAVPEWIDVSDRMPEEGEEVLVHHYGHIVQATKDKKYSGGFKQRNCRGWESVSCYISHWMSMSIKLPESYNFYYEHDAKVAQEKAIIEAQEQSHE